MSDDETSPDVPDVPDDMGSPATWTWQAGALLKCANLSPVFAIQNLCRRRAEECRKFAKLLEQADLDEITGHVAQAGASEAGLRLYSAEGPGEILRVTLQAGAPSFQMRDLKSGAIYWTNFLSGASPVLVITGGI